MRGQVDRRSCAEGRAGFTLLEALVALTVLALVLVSAIGAAAADVRASRAAAARVEAALLAEEVLARLDTWAPLEREKLDRGLGGTFPPPMEHYGWYVLATPAAGEEGLREVEVTVTRGTERFTLHTQRAWAAAPPRSGVGP